MIPSSPSVATFRSRVAEGFRDDGKLDHWDLAWALNALTQEDGVVEDVELAAVRQLVRTDRFQTSATPEAKKLAEAFLGEPTPGGDLPAPTERALGTLGWTAE